MQLTLEPVVVATENGEGRLVFADNRLVAVLVLLSNLHAAAKGRWFLEAGFGSLEGPQQPTFPDLDAALAWISARLEAPPPVRLSSAG